ncbi:MAG: hypothetical protein ACI9MR_000863, partial [Myxococcota bacterium]
GTDNTRVIWNATGGYISIGANANIVGTILARGYVSTGAGSSVTGVGDHCGAVYSGTSYVSIGAGAVIGDQDCDPNCLEADGECANTAIDCEEGNECTRDSCEEGVCVHDATPGSACGDSDSDSDSDGDNDGDNDRDSNSDSNSDSDGDIAVDNGSDGDRPALRF